MTRLRLHCEIKINEMNLVFNKSTFYLPPKENEINIVYCIK
jgi:hypothetical protein